MATDYATTAQLADYFKNVPFTGADGTVAAKMITRASRFIDRATGTFFYQNSVTQLLHDGNGLDSLNTRWPIVSVSLLEQQYYTGGTWQTVTASQYFLYPSPPQDGFPYTEIRLTNIPTQGQATEFWVGRQNVRITGVFGWPSVPDEIVHLTLKLAAKMWKQRDAGWTGIVGSTDTGILMLKNLDGEDREIINAFKKIWIAL